MDRRRMWTKQPPALIANLLLLALLGIGCTTTCPSGYEKMGDLCKIIPKDSGVSASMVNPVSSGGSAALAPAGGAGSSLGTQMAAPAPGGTAGNSSTQGTSSAGANPPGVASSGTKPVVDGGMLSSAENACQGHAVENLCDGATLHHCGGGQSMSAETCMTSALCLAGVKSGVCGICNPGTFRCEGTRLDVCTEAGQFIKQADCATAALCKADAGQCTDMQCMPNAVTCSADGSTLNTCNAEGSGFADQKSCNGKGCNQSTKSCNTCMPGEKSCSGNSLMTCSPDGQSMNSSECRASGECATSTCQQNACVQGTKTTGSSCSSGGKCDGNGQCVACLAASDCPEPAACFERTCRAGVCDKQPKSAGTLCGNGMECNASGTCAQKPCGNGQVDPGEKCDPANSLWKDDPQHACNSSCEITNAVYRYCGSTDKACWPGSPYFCSPVGTCSVACSSAADCATVGGGIPASCVAGYCVLPCRCALGSTCGCPSGLKCVTVGPKSNPDPNYICGWVNFDPNSGPWE